MTKPRKKKRRGGKRKKVSTRISTTPKLRKRTDHGNSLANDSFPTMPIETPRSNGVVFKVKVKRK